MRGYAQGLNSNQGLGFCFLGQRVPRDFVWRTIVRGCVLACSVMGLGLLALGVVTRPALDRSQMLTFLVRAFPGLMCLMGWADLRCPWAVASRGSADLGRGIGPRLVAR